MTGLVDPGQQARCAPLLRAWQIGVVLLLVVLTAAFAASLVLLHRAAGVFRSSSSEVLLTGAFLVLTVGFLVAASRSIRTWEPDDRALVGLLLVAFSRTRVRHVFTMMDRGAGPLERAAATLWVTAFVGILALVVLGTVLRFMGVLDRPGRVTRGSGRGGSGDPPTS